MHLAAHTDSGSRDREPTSASTPIDPAWLSIVRDHVQGLTFGMVQITVHQGRVTQIDATARTRLDADTPAPAFAASRATKSR